MELIGHIGVDSGQMMLCDPCYIESLWGQEIDFAADASDQDRPANTDFSYRGACETTLATPKAGILAGGIGAVCSTGYGDGQYPVYIERDGSRVVRMIIDFDPKEDEETCEDCGGEIWGFNNGSQCPDCEAKEDALNDDNEDE